MNDTEIIRVRAAVNRLADIDATAESTDGLVTASVDAWGELRSLRLDPRIYRTADADALAKTITHTVQSAAHTAHHRVFSAVAPLLPDEVTADDFDPVADPVLHVLARTADPATHS
ncbi:hypothetical protein CFN78_03705 [Amycolatopsis antarctica]|uniref:Uncharacterized protein n=1 Tax=Amycolatopsis antarctica TaxID=1854586 RepID=A0A263D715_9PSEU|nr:YbaB/EbfC family nucleoid-associated protein [Amycolatopsis antarctica]OZM74260.1 hypothetical protein CFN78_03705 [Amycolatopsis antarctica]